MGWFDEQIRERIRTESDMYSDAFARMANVVSCDKLTEIWDTDRRFAEESVNEILKFYKIMPQEVPGHVKKLNDVLEYILRPAGVMRRNVLLTGTWYQDAYGAMLGTSVQGDMVALLPAKFGGYSYKDPKSGKIININRKTSESLDKEAICFYKPLPLRSIMVKDLFTYMLGLIRGKDKIYLFSSAFAVTLLGLIVPAINRYLFNQVLITQNSALLIAAASALLCAGIAKVLIDTIRTIINSDVTLRLDMAVESAVMMRLLSLPPDFFKKYSSGELAERMCRLNSLCRMLFESVFCTVVTAVFSLLYIGQIFLYASALAIPALLLMLVSLGFSLVSAVAQTKVTKQLLTEESKESGIVYSLIQGVSKIKNSGAEKRLFSKWAFQYAKAAKYRYDPPTMLKLTNVIATAITLLGTIVMYFLAVRAGVSTADYMAFNSAYGMVSAAFAALSGVALTAAQIKPILDLIKPVLETAPEITESKTVVSKLRGSIEMNNVSFRYSESMPLILDNLSLKIRPGQYIAIVGKTGCGKSTLMRMLLGFEKPAKGAIYYDGKDMSSMDLKSLRQNIGVVMQNGKLFQGDIFSNITIAAPWLTLDDAWEAAEMAGMAEDIRSMPMGMNTIISEGQGGISGGQRQRIMIARAIAPKPKILMFDEATSALDNLTQKAVSDSLNKLKCTRIVIAHRLSTIKECDRIIVLDKGTIIEDGTYEELIGKNGFFTTLVERQRVE